MLIIRKSQFDAFDKLRPSTFRPKMVQHLTVQFPETSEICGQVGLLKIIDDGLTRLAQFGLKTRYEACIFLDLTVMLGRGFDTDPLLPWVRVAMAQAAPNARSRMDDLMGRAIQYRDRILKEEERFPREAFSKLLEPSYDDVEDELKVLSREELIDYLIKIWPEKGELASPEQWDLLIAESNEKAARYGISSAEGASYILLVMFLLGHHFDLDQQYGWMIQILNDPEYDEEYYKLCSLHFTIQKYFESLMEEIPL